ncbi:phasin family protein [Bifidobacterium choloepi]|uniref:Phasin family protein n=1 Tax=Bifidobacterium choloepi TaxID=2614131 RepID=A0A6I5NES7_9BIFI|nr:phasin family protein [Bifidobacterium choloepi]NEG69854.1 hypothetical protein [Bifidobacterium choloepi]
MADNNNDVFGGLGEGLHKVFLAGVGALATSAEKGREIIDDLVKKGELTVEQGKQLNSELQHKADEKKDTLRDKAKDANETMKNAAAGLRETAKPTKTAEAEGDELAEETEEEENL